MSACRRPSKKRGAAKIETLTTAMAADFQRLLLRDGTRANARAHGRSSIATCELRSASEVVEQLPGRPWALDA
jgi:hypothetical protein